MLTDLFTIKNDEVLSGTYYKRRPKTDTDTGIKFSYDIVDETRKSHSTVLTNIETQKVLQTIKTKAKIDFNEKQYIITQDGTMWQINEVVKTIIKQGTKQALRWFKETIETEYTLRLSQVDNPWGLK